MKSRILSLILFCLTAASFEVSAESAIIANIEKCKISLVQAGNPIFNSSHEMENGGFNFVWSPDYKNDGYEYIYFSTNIDQEIKVRREIFILCIVDRNSKEVKYLMAPIESLSSKMAVYLDFDDAEKEKIKQQAAKLTEEEQKPFAEYRLFYESGRWFFE